MAGGGLTRYDFSGGALSNPKVMLQKAANQVGGLTLAGQNLYVAGLGTGKLFRVPLDGTAPIELSFSPSLGNAREMVAAGSYMYVTTYGTGIRRIG